MKRDKQDRIALIRKGNELFNKGEIDKAIKIFLDTNYKDGLARIGDFYFYDKKAPLLAFKFYKLANMHKKVNEIFERMVFALSKWIGEDSGEEDKAPQGEIEDHAGQSDGMPIELVGQSEETIPVKFSPKLKILAEEILRDNEERNKK